MRLLIDNSALGTLSCERKFQLTVIQGHKPEASESINLGSAGHTFMEEQDKGHNVDESMEIAVTKHGKFDQKKVLMAARMYRSVARPSPAVLINGIPAIEFKFNLPYGNFINPDTNELIEIRLLGTIDRIEYDSERDQVVIKDYKWSGAFNQSHRENIMDAADTSFQLPFYYHALLLMGRLGMLPADLVEYLESGKYRAELHYIFYSCEPPIIKKRQRASFRHDFVTKMIPAIIHNKIHKIVSIAGSKSAAVLDGLLVYGLCNKCPFNIACMDHGTEKETEYLSRIPRVEYDPMTFR